MQAKEIEKVFNRLFAESEKTILKGGASEPLYQPATDASEPFHIVYYRADSAPSALHEIAHWCLAGKRRRTLIDYGYWYCPDGRSPQRQAEFEQVEIRPQALEACFAEVAGVDFVVSIDNIGGRAFDSSLFRKKIFKEKKFFEQNGLPARAKLFLNSLHRHPIATRTCRESQ